MFRSYQIAEGIDCFIWPTTKFKTTGVWVYLHTPLLKERVTANALASMLLPRGTQRWPTITALARHLEELYGAGLSNDVIKRGDSHDLVFRLDVANEKFIPGAEGLTEAGIATLAELVLRPATEGQAFRSEAFNQEKRNLKELIEGLINDKRSYAYHRCVAEMCGDNPFGLYRYGTVAALEGLDPTSLYQHYQKVLETAKVDIFVVGDVAVDQVLGWVEKHFTFPPGRGRQRPQTEILPPASQVRRVEEAQEVSQGVLCLGLTTGVAPSAPNYYAAVVANGILGGYAHSKLFTNVREKESLAYFSYAYFEPHKGFSLMMSGIEFANYQKTHDICLEQLRDVAEGRISDYEFDSTINALTNSIVASQDDPGRMVEAYVDSLTTGRAFAPEARLEALRKVTKDAVAEVAQGFELDTVYFLTRKGGA